MALLFEEESYRILGACFEVDKEKGCGFLEPVYPECLAIEFEVESIPFEQQVELVLTYEGRTLQPRYQPDFLCFRKIVVEIKRLTSMGHNSMTISKARVFSWVCWSNSVIVPSWNTSAS